MLHYTADINSFLYTYFFQILFYITRKCNIIEYRKVCFIKKSKCYVKNILTLYVAGAIIQWKGGEPMTLAERMVEYRAQERISQKALADRCGLSKQTVYSIENGIQEPSRVTQAKIELIIGKETRQ